MRMLSLYERIIQGHVINKSDEASRYFVNEKTIQRDIEDLRNYVAQAYADSSYEIVYDKAKKGYLLDRSASAGLTQGQIYAVIKVLLESRSFPKEEMKALIEILLNQAAPEDRHAMKKALGNEIIHYRDLEWVSQYARSDRKTKPFLDMMWRLSQSAATRNMIRIDYRKVNADKLITRTVHPLGILFSEYYFYLVGMLHGEDHEYPAIYRLDRIDDYTVLAEKFYLPDAKRFQEGEFRKNVQFMQTGDLIKIRFRFFGHSLEAVLDRLPDARIVERTSQGAIIEAEVFGLGIKMWLLSQAQFIEVLKPEAFRQEMMDTIAQMSAVYRSEH